jgi:hypothetical protein
MGGRQGKPRSHTTPAVVAAATALVAGVVCVLVLVGARLPFHGWSADHVAPRGGRARLAAVPEPVATRSPGPVASVRPRPVAPRPARPPRRPPVAAPAPLLQGTGGTGVRGVATPARPRAVPTTVPTAAPTAASRPAPAPIPIPTPPPSPLRETAHQAAATVRDTGRSLDIEEVTDPVAAGLDQAAELLP